MNTYYLIAQGEIIARGPRMELAPLATPDRHLVYSGDWRLGITYLQDPTGAILDLLDETYPPESPVNLAEWHETLARLGVAH